MAKKKLTKDQKRKKKLADRNKKQMQKFAQKNQWPVHSCYISKAAFEEGNKDIVQILITRNFGDNYVSASFIVDLLCFGLKDCFMTPIQTLYETEELVEKLQSGLKAENKEMIKSNIDYAYSFIQSGINYGKKFGFSPHHDFLKVKKILPADILSMPVKHNIHCGDEHGKPVAIMTPYTAPLTETQKTLLHDVGAGFVKDGPDGEEDEAFMWDCEIEELRFSESKYGELDQDSAGRYIEELLKKYEKSEFFVDVGAEPECQQLISKNFDKYFLLKVILESALLDQGLTIGMEFIDFDEIFENLHNNYYTDCTFDDLIVGMGQAGAFCDWLFTEFPKMNTVNIDNLEKTLRNHEYMREVAESFVNNDDNVARKVSMAAIKAGVDISEKHKLGEFIELVNTLGGIDYLEQATEIFRDTLHVE